MSFNNNIFLATAPRRFGKSIVQSMIITAAALVVPDLTVAVFATNQRISGNMGKMIIKCLEMSGNSHRIKTNNQETIEIEGDTPGDIRIISCYPSSARISCLLLLSILNLSSVCSATTLFITYSCITSSFLPFHPPFGVWFYA